MRRLPVILSLLLILALPSFTRSSRTKGVRPARSHTSYQTHIHQPRAAKHSRTHRNAAARAVFVRRNPCPSTGRTSGACPGYVVDHIVPLKRGGADAPSNMQWQTVQAAKAKDRIE